MKDDINKDVDYIRKKTGLDDLLKEVKERDPSTMARKISYLQKLNGGLITFLVNRNIMTKAEAQQIISKARREA